MCDALPPVSISSAFANKIILDEGHTVYHRTTNIMAACRDDACDGDNVRPGVMSFGVNIRI